MYKQGKHVCSRNMSEAIPWVALCNLSPPARLIENIFVRSLSLSYNLQCESLALVTLSSTTHVLLRPRSIGESPSPEIPISTLLVFSPDPFLASIEALC